MKRIDPQPHWPETWRTSYAYDLQEIYGEITSPGYAYAYENRWNVTRQLVLSCLPRGSKILDVAAAQGNFTLRYDRVIAALPELRARFPDLAYAIAGDGDDRPRLEALAREQGVADIAHFLGRVPDDELV